MSGPHQKPDLAIRARPKPVRRFSKKALVLGASCLSLVMCAALAFALQPPTYTVSENTELYNVTHKPVAEGLELLPKSYAELKPKLGPPLPGDLGAAYIDKGHGIGNQDENPFKFTTAEPSKITVKKPASHTRIYKAPPKPSKKEVPAVDAKLKKQAEIRAANLFFSLGSKATRPDQLQPNFREPVNTPFDFQNFGTSQGFGRAIPEFGQADRQSDIYNSHDLQSPRSPYQVMAGTLIPASLVTGLNSDLPGQVIGQVSENVYDTVSGNHLLIPQGAKLIGEYDNAISYGQSRALIVWTRLIFPNGNSIVLDNTAAVDGMGHAGLKDKVDRHTWGLVKGAALSSLLGIGAELATDNDDRIIRALQSSGQESLNQAGQRIVDKSLNIAPTITVRSGWRFSVLVGRDLILKPYNPNQP